MSFSSKFLPQLTASFVAPAEAALPESPLECRLTRTIVIDHQYEGVSHENALLLTFRRSDLQKFDIEAEIKSAIYDDIEELLDQHNREIGLIHAQQMGEISGAEIEIKSPYMNPNAELKTSYVLLMDNGLMFTLYEKKGSLVSHLSEQIEMQVHRAMAPAIPLQVRDKGFGF